MTYILLILGIIFLIKGADFLIEGSVSLAKRYHVSNLVIGLTLVAFGTSAPELVVNLTSSILGKSDLAIGNILGSNIANILLILGVSALLYPIKTQKKTLFLEIPFNLFLVGILFILANDSFSHSKLGITRIDGIILLILLGLFLYYAFFTHKKIEPEEEISLMSLPKSSIYIIFGIVGLYFGGKWVVKSAIEIAQNLGVSEEVIGLTVVAVGTSLPELFTSIVATLKKEADIAIGNVVGSNIFNITWILGLSSIIRPISFNPISNFSLLILSIATILLFTLISLSKKRELNFVSGIIFLSVYGLYIFYIFFK